MPVTDVSATASDQPLAVVAGPELSSRASHGIPRVDRPRAIAPNARTIPMTLVRTTGLVKADPISPQNGTSQTV